MAEMRGRIGFEQLNENLVNEILRGNGDEGSSYIAILRNSVTLNTISDTVGIGIPQFNKETDELTVYRNGIYMELGNEYIINPNNTISRTDGEPWDGRTDSIYFNFMVFRNAPSGDVKLDGQLLIRNSVSYEKLTPELQEMVDRVGNGSGNVSAVYMTFRYNEWRVDSSGLYKITISHMLNTPIVDCIAYDDLKRRMYIASEIVNDNNVIIFSDEPFNMTISIMNVKGAE